MDESAWSIWSLVGLLFGGFFFLIAVIGLVYPAITRRKRVTACGRENEDIRVP